MNEKVYAEVRCDYFNEEENCWYVDAWKTDDDNEEGRTLAAINGTTGDVFYIDKSVWDLKEVREVVDEKRKEILSKPIRMSIDVLTSFNEDTEETHPILVIDPRQAAYKRKELIKKAIIEWLDKPFYNDGVETEKEVDRLIDDIALDYEEIAVYNEYFKLTSFMVDIDRTHLST